MDATDTGYGFSMNGIQPIGTITTGNRYFVKLNKSMNENNTRFNIRGEKRSVSICGRSENE